MKFDELDERMRVFETAHDLCVLPGLHMVARLDGRSFTRLTKEVHKFEAPFDARFRDMMLATAEHLMAGCGFNIIYGYTQSDEISLLGRARSSNASSRGRYRPDPVRDERRGAVASSQRLHGENLILHP
jgi:tRNA(His) 5'-end guanylyltransferase